MKENNYLGKSVRDCRDRVWYRIGGESKVKIELSEEERRALRNVCMTGLGQEDDLRSSRERGSDNS